MASDSYLSIAAAAAHLGLSSATIRRWIDQGALPAVKVGPKPRGSQRDNRPVRVRVEDLNRIIEPFRAA